jgi:hypothetical protein
MVTFIALEAVVEGAGRVLYSSPWATTSQKSSIWQLYIGEEKWGMEEEEEEEEEEYCAVFRAMGNHFSNVLCTGNRSPSIFTSECC